MDTESTKRFLNNIGISFDDMIVDEDRGWVRSPCPFAPWKHKSGKDSKPSFGITIRSESDETQSVAQCFSCGEYYGDRTTWSIPEVIVRFKNLSKEFPRAAFCEYIYNSSHHEFDPVQLSFDEAAPKDPPEPLPYRLLHKYPTIKSSHSIEAVHVKQYLSMERNIPMPIQYLFGVRVDEYRAAMVFPLSCLDGRIYTLRVRAIGQKKIWTVNSKVSGMTDVLYPKLTESGAMFGFNVFDTSKPFTYICEGEIDAMRLFQLSGCKNVLGSATNQITNQQLKNIQPLVSRVTLAYDADKAGAIAVKRAGMFFSQMGIDVDVLDFGIVGCKDPGDIKKQEDFDHVSNNSISVEKFLDKYK